MGYNTVGEPIFLKKKKAQRVYMFGGTFRDGGKEKRGNPLYVPIHIHGHIGPDAQCRRCDFQCRGVVEAFEVGREEEGGTV